MPVNEMRVMDVHLGDIRQTWDPENAAETAEAKALFEKMRGKGYVGYYVDTKGKQTKEMKAFDPQAGAIVMAPFVSGG